MLFNDGPLAGQKFSATVADARYIETVKFPKKGSIEFHSAYGANTTSSASGASSTLDVVNAVIAQSKSIRGAWRTLKSTEQESKNAAAALLKAKNAKAAGGS
ncbi:hypothetical protein [Pseudomonas hunanensis]|uniref:hypothetical protein n=1 Tax=Pseudomonas hunanensis TaxID=1247546 RepID=UPI0030DC59C6